MPVGCLCVARLLLLLPLPKPALRAFLFHGPAQTKLADRTMNPPIFRSQFLQVLLLMTAAQVKVKLRLLPLCGVPIAWGIR
jgi:hypothetical protein